MMKFVSAIGLLFMSGCMATSGAIREISTDPQGAQITIVGYGECTSPCTIKLDGPRQIKVAKAGFVSKTYEITPGMKDMVIPLELAAPSGDVDETALPELD